MRKSRNAKYWHEFRVGETFETAGRTIESGDVHLFAGLSGDFNPAHMDRLYAEKGQFGEPIGHGLLTLAVTSGQLNGTGVFEGSVIAFLGMNNVRFASPVRFGDTVLTTFTITSTRESASKPGRGVVAMTIKVTNQRGETVLTYDQAMLMHGESA